MLVDCIEGLRAPLDSELAVMASKHQSLSGIRRHQQPDKLECRDKDGPEEGEERA